MLIFLIHDGKERGEEEKDPGKPIGRDVFNHKFIKRRFK